MPSNPTDGMPSRLNLTIEPWRIKLALGFLAVLALYNIASTLSSMQSDTRQLREVAQVESEEYPTPPGLEKRIQNYQHTLGGYRDVPVDDEDDDE